MADCIGVLGGGEFEVGGVFDPPLEIRKKNVFAGEIFLNKYWIE